MPVGAHGAGKDIGVQLRVFDLTEVLGQSFTWERLGLLLASFVPSHPPSVGVLSLVHPCLLHDPYCIGAFRGEGEWQAPVIYRAATKW